MELEGGEKQLLKCRRSLGLHLSFPVGIRAAAKKGMDGWRDDVIAM